MDEYLEVAAGVQAAELQAFYKRLMSRCGGRGQKGGFRREGGGGSML